MKKEENSGFSGHIFSEIPTSKSFVYSFPACGINYNFKKINLQTSYNGEINYEDIDEITNREIRGTAPQNISSIQNVRQKNLSHKFNYSVDYYLSSRDVFNLYGFYNPYSYEQDGNIIFQTSEDNIQNIEYDKEETDRNRNFFNSLYYQHKFNKKGREMTIDISNAYLRSNNRSAYLNSDKSDSVCFVNTESPRETSTSIKIDFTSPMGENLKISSGIKAKFKKMHDNTSINFNQKEQLYALYSTINYKQQKYNFNIGLRAEDAEVKPVNAPDKSMFSLLPNFSFHYKLNVQQNIILSYRRSLTRPSIYSLNPYTYSDDPYTVRKGNPLLQPEVRNNLYLEHSIRFLSSYISSRLYYEMERNVINNLTILNDNSVFEIQKQNLGTIHQYGMQLSGSLKYGLLTFTPSIRLYNQSTHGNNLAKQYNLKTRNDWVFESDVSTVLSLRNNFALSFIYQYSSAKNYIQDNTFSDALYIVSINKTFKKNFKVGVKSALPFTKTFVYQGSEIDVKDFSSRYTGNLKLPAVPLMFMVSYQFNTGKNRNTIKRDKEKITKRP